MPKRDLGKRELRAFPLMVRRDADGAEGTEEQDTGMWVEGYATTFEEPYTLFVGPDGPENEMVSRHALDGADLSDVILLYDHEGMVFARTRNGTLELTVDDHGLHVRADLSRTTAARELMESISAGMVVEMSWCFIIEEEHWEADKRCWIIDKVGKVYDVSAVSIPADPSTTISEARKRSRDGVIEAERAERLAADRQRKLQIVRMKAKIAAQKG